LPTAPPRKRPRAIAVRRSSRERTMKAKRPTAATTVKIEISSVCPAHWPPGPA